MFDAVVPVLILLAGRADGDQAHAERPHASAEHTAAGTAAAFATGIYGGYFGAAQGIILMSLLRFCFPDDLQRLNGLKNVLAGVANGVAAILFIFVADVAWDAAALIARRLDRRRAGRRALRPPHPVRGAALDRGCRRARSSR